MERIAIMREFLGRLARDARGNTIALMAAALLPLAGLIGGGVDMSRLYLTKTRLQQACDAGALAGRKAMGSGAWTKRSDTGTTGGANSDEAQSENMFNANFASGQYGTGSLTKSFTLLNNDNSAGVINGVASATVPMTIMKVFGMTSRTISVSCNSKMELPNTDVMFVLDVTYSMQCAPSATSDTCSPTTAPNRRIDGLKHAVDCFYEALEKVNTPELCTPDGVGTSDPTATTASTSAQVRIGFVPYGVNVNVGKVLPNSVMADNWTYQSRVPIKPGVEVWSLGAETPASNAITNWGSWSSAPSASTLSNSSNYSSWSNVSGSGNITINGTSYAKAPTGKTNVTCPALNTLSGGTMLAYVDTDSGVGSPTLQSTTNSPATYVGPNNPSQQVLTYSESDSHSVTGYKYVWSGSSCKLQNGTFTGSGYPLTRTGSTTKAITWTLDSNAVTGWTYQPVSHNVSGLKAGGSSWNNSVSLPVSVAQSGPSVTVSGSNTSAQLYYSTNSSVTWDGCIEEAQTWQTSNTDPSNDWNTIPSTAWDMNINLIPSTTLGSPTFSQSGTTFSYGPGSYWGPMLSKTGGSNSTGGAGSNIYGAVWARYTGSTTSNWTQSPVTVNSVANSSQLSQDNYTYMCTTSAARKLQVYNTAGSLTDSSTFIGYVNALDAQDLGTYHDIGMLWGARLLSPTGIFASENASAPTGGAIQRHLIFMTDGNVHTVYNNYNAYGLAFFNRYQTSYDPTCGTTCTSTDNLVNARLSALCTAIKNMNITLWVVSYGSAVNTTTQTRLQNCATNADTVHFVSATNTASLTAQFQTIAAKISELRLTS